MTRKGGQRYGARLLALLLVAVTAVTAQGTLHDEAEAQQPSRDANRDDHLQASIRQRGVAISRTPEGLTLGGTKAEVVKQIGARWGAEYLPLNIVWDPYWYPRSRTASGRFTPRRCGGNGSYLPICEGTLLRSTTASMIEIVTFRERVFRIAITLPVVPDYRLQSQNMMSLLRQKYGPPTRGTRWRDEVTELTFDDAIIRPGWPATLQYVDISRSAEVERAAEQIAEAHNARLRERSLRTPRGY